MTKPIKSCWWCNRKLWGGKGVIKMIDGHPRILHKICLAQIREDNDLAATAILHLMRAVRCIDRQVEEHRLIEVENKLIVGLLNRKVKIS